MSCLVIPQYYVFNGSTHGHTMFLSQLCEPIITSNDRPAINVQLKVPEDTFFFEDPLLARWDEAHSVWRQDGFQDTNYVEGGNFVLNIGE